MTRPGTAGKACAGQALVESLVVVLALGAMFVAIPWLGRFQDIALQAGHASRFAAFSLARDNSLRPLPGIHRHFFSGSSHQWATSHGDRIVGDDSQISLAVSTLPNLNVLAQPGGIEPDASAQRRGLRIGEQGLMKARVAVSFPSNAAPVAPDAAKAPAYPSVARHVAILVDAGHASDDTSVQQRVANSEPAWANMAESSHSLGRRAAGISVVLDKGWGREAPSFDWLEPWAGRLPAYRLGYAEHPS
jgi:hypothetical protein